MNLATHSAKRNLAGHSTACVASRTASNAAFELVEYISMQVVMSKLLIVPGLQTLVRMVWRLIAKICV
jgi:hypothetical protein